MKLTLAENIRTFRKERRYTQEQLAEILGVTAGAVYKWESGQSVPELGLLVEMADFFDVSVDALLGYRMKDNGIEATKQRLDEYSRNRDPQALAEAEKALQKYPNSFEIVFYCAVIYLIFGVGKQGKPEARRALELLERARPLLIQNTNPQIGEQTLCGLMAEAYDLMGEKEKGVELLKKHNTGGVFSDMIGMNLAANLHRPEEAEPYLSEALMQSVSSLFNAVMGFAAVYSARGDHLSAEGIASWGLTLIRGLKKETGTDFLDKAQALLLAALAHAQLKAGNTAEARSSLAEAAALARRFDAAPDYSISSMRYMTEPEEKLAYDTLGATASESVGTLLENLGSEELRSLWEEAENHE